MKQFAKIVFYNQEKTKFIFLSEALFQKILQKQTVQKVTLKNKNQRNRTITVMQIRIVPVIIQLELGKRNR